MCRIDLNDPTLRGTWRLSDGTLPLYTNWNIQYKQPNNGYGGEYYVIMNAGDVGVYNGSWFDAPDGSFAHALCNLPPPPSPPPPSPPPSPPPPSDNATSVTTIVIVITVAVALVALVAILAIYTFKKRHISPQTIQASLQGMQMPVQAQAIIGTPADQGMVMTAQPVMPALAQPAAQPQDTLAALRELKGLLDDGVLTQEEFDAEKQKVLGEKISAPAPAVAKASSMPQPAKKGSMV